MCRNPRSSNNLKDGLEFAGKIASRSSSVLVSHSVVPAVASLTTGEELMEVLARGLDLSPVHECLIEESVLGWKEYELEVMRDTKDNVIIICSIENFDPMECILATRSPSRPRRPSLIANIR